MYLDTVQFTDNHDHYLTDEAKALIKKAANLLETYGWVKGAYSVRTGYCIVGALMQVSGRFPISGTVELSLANSPALAEAINLVAKHIPPIPEEELTAQSTKCPLHSQVETWNDSPQRTKKQVLRLMRKVAT